MHSDCRKRAFRAEDEEEQMFGSDLDNVIEKKDEIGNVK